MSAGYTLTYTDRFEELMPFYVAQGIDGKPDDPRPKGYLTCIELSAEESGQMMAAATISHHDGIYHLNYLAVYEVHRGNDYGTALVHECIEEIKRRGGNAMWLTGMAPGFYEKRGFREASIEESPLPFNCPNCNQYKKNCFPAIMCKEF